MYSVPSRRAGRGLCQQGRWEGSVARNSLTAAEIEGTLARLSAVDERMAREFPGGRGTRQPVHTCYVPADRVDADVLLRWSREALTTLDTHAPGPDEFAEAIGIPREHAQVVHPRVRQRLLGDPVEDLRIDFEDGYGQPADDTEDSDAVRTAAVVAEWVAQGVAPANIGLRVKSFDTPELRARCARTLDIFLTELSIRGRVPAGLVLTFPKVVDRAQVEVFVEILESLEAKLGLDPLRFEIQVETPQSIVDSEGRMAIPGFLRAGNGRVSGLHFGTYDYTAACGITGANQHLAHRACDFARHVMQVCAAGTGVLLSDGSTNVLPVGEQVHHGWRTHYQLVRRSLEHGFHQGWDLHPAQLVTRYAAVFTAFWETADADARRLGDYVHARASAVQDEPATVRALAVSFVRAMDSGATDPDEVREMTGVAESELRELAGL